MGFCLPRIVQAKRIVHKTVLAAASTIVDIPKGCLVVYVGDTQKKLFVVPVTYLNQPTFQELLNQVEEEFGFDHPIGGLTIPCSEDTFIDLISSFN